MRLCRCCGWEYNPITAKECRDCDGEARNCMACGETGMEHPCIASQAINRFREGMQKAALADEIGWLIETTASAPTLYWSEEGFCPIASHGERFSSEAEALKVASTVKTPTACREHRWQSAPTVTAGREP